MPPTGCPWPRLANHRPRCRQFEAVGTTPMVNALQELRTFAEAVQLGRCVSVVADTSGLATMPAAGRSWIPWLCSGLNTATVSAILFPLTPRRPLAAQPPHSFEATRLGHLAAGGSRLSVNPSLPALPPSWPTTASAVDRSIKPAPCRPPVAPNAPL